MVNYRYFVSGGPERYMFNLTHELAKTGHEIVPFSIHYNQNVPTPYAKYFVEPLGSQDEVYFDDQKMTPQTFIKSLKRLFYAKDVENAIVRMIDETKPDVAYVLHFLRKLSPSVLVGIKSKNIPIIVRLSDFQLLCPQSHCLRDSSPCTRCIEGSFLSSVRYKCVKGGLVASALNALATMYHNYKRYFDLIDTFVVTNEFMYSMMVGSGVSKSRLAIIPTFTDTELLKPSANYAKKPYILYSGRLDEIKGVHVLLNAFALLIIRGTCDNIQLKIAGHGSRNYIDQLKKIITDLDIDKHVEFLGNLGLKDLSTLIAGAQFSVIPSLCYENLPNAALESFACGTPVIASDLGCLPEIITNGSTGYVFRAGDHVDLAQKMMMILKSPAIAKRMAINSRKKAVNCFSSQKHIDSLVQLFQSRIMVDLER